MCTELLVFNKAVSAQQNTIGYTSPIMITLRPTLKALLNVAVSSLLKIRAIVHKARKHTLFSM